MADSFIPTKDADALAWMLAFSSGISANPALYQLTSADAAGITAAYQAFLDAYDFIQIPVNKSKPNVAAKDDARTAAEQLCRQIAIGIKYSASISDPDKINIGVRPVTTTRDPNPPPESSPVLSIFGAGYATHTVRFVDSTTPNERGKPYGVKQLQLFYHIGDEPPAMPEDAKFHGLHTKSPIGIAFDPADVGKQVKYWARWCLVKGETGPWSAPVSMAIAQIGFEKSLN